MESAIKISNLSFGYNSQQNILNDINITVPKGAIYGFLGPNGSGKSTTMRLLTGLINAPKGTIQLFDKDIDEQLPHAFRDIGSIIDSPTIYYHLSGYNNLKYLASIHKVSEDRINEVLDLVGLSAARDKKAGKYSLGMKQRLAIGMALLHRPQLLLLDEPVNGLDPNGMVEIRNLLIEINKQEGVTIFISSHLLAEIEKMCTHIGMIHKGKVYFEGNIQDFGNKNGKNSIQVLTANPSLLTSYLQQQEIPYQINEQTKYFIIDVDNDEKISLLINEFVHNNIPLIEIKKQENLEDWFMNIVANN